MADFARTTRQNAIWDRMGAIRIIVGAGLRSPDDEGYTGDDGELQAEWEALVLEYAAIHTANETKG